MRLEGIKLTFTLRLSNPALHSSESSKGQVDQHKFAAGCINLFRCSWEGILERQLSEVGHLQHSLQLRKLSRAACCAGLLSFEEKKQKKQVCSNPTVARLQR